MSWKLWLPIGWMSVQKTRQISLVNLLSLMKNIFLISSRRKYTTYKKPLILPFTFVEICVCIYSSFNSCKLNTFLFAYNLFPDYNAIWWLPTMCWTSSIQKYVGHHFFFQDVLMDKHDNHPRPVRYNTYIKSLSWFFLSCSFYSLVFWVLHILLF